MITQLINIGFTGTRKGMTEKQKTAFQAIISSYININYKVKFIHGDCIGADADAHVLCRNLGIKNIDIYPCSISSQRAYTDGNEICDPMHPLERNKLISDSCDLLLACPGEMHEVLRSGTWSTIRYRSNSLTNFNNIIIWPDGSISYSY